MIIRVGVRIKPPGVSENCITRIVRVESVSIIITAVMMDPKF